MNKILMAAAVFITSVSVAANPNSLQRPVKVISMQMDCFYFKVDKELIGASVIVYSSKGEKLIAQTIKDRRLLLDLYYLHSGIYKIVIAHNGHEYAFDYQKKTEVPFGRSNAQEMIS